MISSVPNLQEQYLISVIEDWSVSNGLAMRPLLPLLSSGSKDNQTCGKNLYATSAPVTLFPSPFPRTCFEQAHGVQKDYNHLYASISQDEEFLQVTVEEIIKIDEFIANLWKVHIDVKNEGYTQKLSLGLFRSDYLVDQSTPDSQPIIKQVEFNTIAASFCGLSSRTSELHRFLVQNEYLHLLENYDTLDNLHLPENESITGISCGLRTAFNHYMKQSSSKHECCIIFLVQDNERNIFDQRLLEYALKDSNPSIPIFRLSFSQVLANTRIGDSPKRELFYHFSDNSSRFFEVAVVYFRAGYDPSDYLENSAWKARLKIERSNAIKCPTILTQLAGSKKVQQVLSAPNSTETRSLLGRFLPDNDEVLSRIENTFTSIYPLDDSPAGLEAQKLATNAKLCNNYVLKPQREGGGNNIYRSAIPAFLNSLPKHKWKSYILMKIINTPKMSNSILRNGIIERGGIISELGVYGSCLWNQQSGEIQHNEIAGYLLRTKGDQSEEGGVAAGYGCMDSCYLG